MAQRRLVELSSFGALSVREQLEVWDNHTHDPRGRVGSGFAELDALLHRGGVAAGEMVVLGGRSGTRKTTVTVNLVARQLADGHAVGLIGLDEGAHSYIAKVCSAITGVPHGWLEENWDEPGAKEVRNTYEEVAARFTLSSGYSPNFDELSFWLGEAELRSARPEVVFIDYLALLDRDKFHGQDVTRIPRVLEDLKRWTSEHQLVTVVLQQTNLGDDRYDGSTPMTLDRLKYGGGEVPDVVLATYRPAKDRIGNMAPSEARAAMGDRWDEDTYFEHVQRVKKWKDSTFLQLLKNRPGVHLEEKGIELYQPNDSMQMLSPCQRENAE